MKDGLYRRVCDAVARDGGRDPGRTVAGDCFFYQRLHKNNRREQ